MNRYIDSPFDNVILPRGYPWAFLPRILFFKHHRSSHLSSATDRYY
nr:MAG TPA: hypothetical protein [Caudoviricetes sp.]